MGFKAKLAAYHEKQRGDTARMLARQKKTEPTPAAPARPGHGRRYGAKLTHGEWLRRRSRRRQARIDRQRNAGTRGRTQVRA